MDETAKKKKSNKIFQQQQQEKKLYFSCINYFETVVHNSFSFAVFATKMSVHPNETVFCNSDGLEFRQLKIFCKKLIFTFGRNGTFLT